MKTFFSTKENWLLIVPLLLWLFEKTVVGYSMLDVHLHDTYFVFSNVSFGVIFLWVIIIPFCCHVLLRKKTGGKFLFLLLHVIFSCLLYLAVYSIFTFRINHGSIGLAGMPRRYYDYSTWEDPLQRYMFFQQSMIGLAALFMLLQLLLMAYTLFMFLKKTVNTQPV